MPADLLYEDDDVVAINDLNPRAPLHALVIPRRHVERLADLEDEALAGRITLAAAKVARAQGHADAFRVVVNRHDFTHDLVNHL